MRRLREDEGGKEKRKEVTTKKGNDRTLARERKAKMKIEDKKYVRASPVCAQWTRTSCSSDDPVKCGIGR